MQYTEKQFVNPERTSHILSTLIRWIVGIEIFLMPLLFLPLTTEFYETPKLVFLAVTNLVLVSLMLLQYAVKNEFRLFRTHLEFFFLFVLLASILSTVLAIDHNTAMWGYFGRGSDTFIYFLSLISFVYILVNTLQTEVDLERYVDVFMASSLVLGVLFFMQQFMGNNVLFSHYALLGYKGFSPVLSTDVLAYYALIPLFVGFGVIYNAFSTGIMVMDSFLRMCLAFVTVVSMIICIALATSAAWPIVLLVVGAAYFLYLLSRLEKHISTKFLVITGFFALCTVLPIIIHSVVKVNSSPLAVLSVSDTWAIYVSVIHNIWMFLFGSGPDTFYFAFLKFVPAAYYTTPQYGTDFSKASIQLLQSLTTQGIVGTLAFLSLVLASLFSSWKAFKQTEDTGSRVFIAAFSAAIVVYFFSWFVANTSLAFDFAFFLLAGFVAYERTITNTAMKGFMNIKIVIENYWDKTSIIVKNSIYILCVLFLLLLGYLDVANYVAQAQYYASLSQTNAQTRYNLALAAAEHNPNIDYYQNNFASAGLQVALAIASNLGTIKDNTQKQNASTLEQNLVKQSIQKSNFTLVQNQLNPNDMIANINLLAIVSKNLGNDTTYIAASTQEAEFLNSLYPNNINYMNITGQLYLQAQQYDKALNIYKQLYAINNTDVNFDFNYALALEGKKQYTEAVGVLQAIAPKLDKKSNAYQLVQEKIAADKAAK